MEANRETEGYRLSNDTYSLSFYKGDHELTEVSITKGGCTIQAKVSTFKNLVRGGMSDDYKHGKGKTGCIS